MAAPKKRRSKRGGGGGKTRPIRAGKYPHRLQIAVSTELFRKVKREADAETVSLSTYVRRLIRQQIATLDEGEHGA